MTCLTKLKKYFGEMFFPPGTTPVSTMFLIAIAFASFSYSMVITMPFAFLPSMIKSFGYPEKEIGFYAGVVAASFYAGKTLASYFWGWLCDHSGSKRCLMITKALLLAMTILFGLSKNVAWAIGARLSQGLVGAILVTLKAAAFSVCDRTNNGIAYATIFSAFSVGQVAGPALGGYLVYPCKQFPKLCSKRSTFGSYPFLLPNLVCAAFLFLSVVLSYFYVPAASSSAPEIQNTEDISLLQQQSKNAMLPDCKEENDEQIGTDSYFHIDDRNCRQNDSLCMSCCRLLKQSSFYKLMRLKPVVVSMCLYAVISFMTVGFSEVYPVFADSPHQYGGLQFTAEEIGRSLLFSALPLIFFCLTLPGLNQKLGETIMIIWTFDAMIFCIPLFPLMSVLNKSIVWLILVPSIFWIKYCVAGNMFAVNLLMNNSTPPELIGAVNGLGMTLSCLFGMLSPATLGPLYTWSLGNEGKIGFPFNHCFSFVLLGFLCFLSLFLTIWIPNEKCDRAKNNSKVDEIQPAER